MERNHGRKPIEDVYRQAFEEIIAKGPKYNLTDTSAIEFSHAAYPDQLRSEEAKRIWDDYLCRCSSLLNYLGDSEEDETNSWLFHHAEVPFSLPPKLLKKYRELEALDSGEMDDGFTYFNDDPSFASLDEMGWRCGCPVGSEESCPKE